MRKSRRLIGYSGIGGRTRKRREAQRQKSYKGYKVSLERCEASDYAGESAVEKAQESRGGGMRLVEVKGNKPGLSSKRVLEKVRKRRGRTVKVGEGKRKEQAVGVWEEEMVRVGTGYRVRWVNQDERKREFDVGYGDMKTYERKPGVEVELAKNNIGRRIRYDEGRSGTRKGIGARERVMNEVCNRERRRKRSVYTGCGRTRKSRVGKKKLKPTKVTAR